MIKYWLILLLLLNLLLLPCGCVTVMGLLNSFNPMQLAFITDIQVTNATDEPLRVTPIGAIGAEGRRIPLPIFRQRSPAYPATQVGGFLVQPGASIEILYDWDDVNLAEIVVENSKGDLRQLVADPDPTRDQYHPAEPNTFTISDFPTLDPVGIDTLAAYHEAQSAHGPWFFYTVIALPWISFPILLTLTIRRWRRNQAAQAGNISAVETQVST